MKLYKQPKISKMSIKSHLLQYSLWGKGGLVDWLSASLASSLASETFDARELKQTDRCHTSFYHELWNFPVSLPFHLPTERSCSLFYLDRPNMHKTSDFFLLLYKPSQTAR